MPRKPAKVQFTNLTLTGVNREYWINTIKVVRELSETHDLGFGLKESKEFVDVVREGKNNTLLRQVSMADARAAKREFAKVGAKVMLGKYDSQEAEA